MQLEFNDVHEHFVVDVVVLHCNISPLAVSYFVIDHLHSLDTVRNKKRLGNTALNAQTDFFISLSFFRNARIPLSCAVHNYK